MAAVYPNRKSAAFFIFSSYQHSKEKEFFMQLVIAEKPSVARSIAGVTGADKRKDGYMEGNSYIVSWCIGHLVELAQPESYREAWKKWIYENLPIIPDKWQHEVTAETAAQYKVLKELMHDARVDSVVCATDVG